MSISINFDIVIGCHKKDFFLTSICVASIRYYYPDVSIFITKDLLNGTFDTSEMEKHFQVKVLDIGSDKLGWGMSKLLLACSQKYKGRKFLVIDSDTVFIGKVLETIQKYADKYDFVISIEENIDPDSSWFSRTYFDHSWVKVYDPSYEFPGYSFNTGTILFTVGRLDMSNNKDIVQTVEFPYWTKFGKEKMICADQSFFNYLLAKETSEGKTKIGKFIFQLWSESKRVKDISIEEVKQGSLPFIVHWAGAVRIPYLKKMTRSDIMLFFQKEYYRRLPLGEIRRLLNNLFAAGSFHTSKLIKSIIRRI